MLLLDLTLLGIELGGNLTMSLQLSSDDGSIEAVASGDISLIATEEDPPRWNSIWLILTDGESGDLLSLSELEGVEEKVFNLDVSISNNCGFLLKQQLTLGLMTTQ